MLPWLPFAAGMVTGAVAIKLLRTDSTRVGLDKAQEKLRNATVSGLAAIEGGSAAFRERLAATPTSVAAVSAPAEPKGRVRKPAAKVAKLTKTAKEAKPKASTQA
jgi:hypothetical protein